MGQRGTHQADLFDGATYEPLIDKERLGKQARAVYDVMIDRRWRSSMHVMRIIRQVSATAALGGRGKKDEDMHESTNRIGQFLPS